MTLLPGPVRVTEVVWGEVTTNRSRPGFAALIRGQRGGLFEVVDEGDPTRCSELDAGEASVISAAAAVGGGVLLDERKARALAHSESAIVWVGGVAAILVVAKRLGRIEEVRPLLDQLRRETFRISPELYSRVLRSAGEDVP